MQYGHIFTVSYLIAVLVLLTACGASEEPVDASGEAGEDQGPPVAVYLQRQDTNESSRPVPERQYLTTHGIQAVSTTDELTAAVGELHPVSIWIDAEVLPEVSSVWLQQQSRSSTVVVGINATVNQLAEQLRAYVEHPDRSDWKPAEAPYFAAYYEVSYEFTNREGEPALGFSSGWRVDEFDPQQPDVITGYVRHAAEIIEASRLQTDEPPVPTVTR